MDSLLFFLIPLAIFTPALLFHTYNVIIKMKAKWKNVCCTVIHFLAFVSSKLSTKPILRSRATGRRLRRSPLFDQPY